MDASRNLADAAARKQAERNAAMTPFAKFKRFCLDVGSACARVSVSAWGAAPHAIRAVFLFVAFCVALGFLSVMTWWELGNAGSGYSLIFAGWGADLAWWGGVAVAGWYMWSHRQHKEQSRAREDHESREKAALASGNSVLAEAERRNARLAKERSGRWMISTVLCAAVTLFGVFSNLVSHASMNTRHAIEVEEDRAELRRVKSRLVRELGALPKPTGVEDTKETLNQYLAEATGWEMANLDAVAPADAPKGYVGPACNANLQKKRPRELCKLASDLRAEIIDNGQMQAELDAKQREIDDTQAKIDATQPVSGAAHYQAMAKLVLSLPMVPPDWDEQGVAGSIQIWGVLFLAIAGLYVCAIGWDSLGENVENRGRKKPAVTAEKG